MLSITLKSHKATENIYINSIQFGSSIKMALDNFNNYRREDSKISKLYNPFGQLIKDNLWDIIQIKENITLYIDTPNI